MLTKAQRLQLIIDALVGAPLATSHDEAYALISSTVNTIEEAHSGVHSNPDAWESDGRIYPPQSDRAQPAVEYTEVVSYRSKKHVTLIAANGTFEIRIARTNKLLCGKLGADGRDMESFRSQGVN